MINQWLSLQVFGFVMESAKQEVKDVADFITKSNNNDEFAFE